MLTHEDYFNTVAPDILPRLLEIQQHVESLLPGVTRCVSYKMPAYRGKKVFFYFAAFKQHVGIYPPVHDPVPGDRKLVAELAPFRGPKGNLAFKHSQPLPIALIGRVAIALHRQYHAS